MPMGGYKVVFEYSNRLVSDGFEVGIIYPFFLSLSKSTFRNTIKRCLYFVYYLVAYRKDKTCWFPLDKKVKEIFVWNLNEKYIPKADYYIATAMETSENLNQYKTIESHQKYYLIQGLEDWTWGKEAVLKTWKYKLNKIVISPWLQSMVQSLGESSTLIENGVDRALLKKEILPVDRDKFTVMMLYHKQKLKGSEDGLRALLLVKKKYPSLKAVWFGASAKPANLPDWIEYNQQPVESVLNELYNRSAIYIGPSHSEGFGLTIGEAMMCGCAVACTDAGGYLTMAKDRKTALISKIGEVQSLADNIIELIENDVLRCNIADNGSSAIQSFTWAKAYKTFKKLFE